MKKNFVFAAAFGGLVFWGNGDVTAQILEPIRPPNPVMIRSPVLSPLPQLTRPPEPIQVPEPVPPIPSERAHEPQRERQLGHERQPVGQREPERRVREMVEAPDGSGAGGGNTTRYLPVPIVVDCDNYPALCSTMSWSNYLRDMDILMTGESPYDKISNYVERATRREPVLIQLPRLMVDREAALRAIFHLQAQVLQIVERKLRDDVRRLHAFRWDSESERQQKMTLARQDDGAITRKMDWARVEMSSEQRRGQYSGASTFHVRFGDAYRQLVYAASTGVGIPSSW